MNDGSGPVRSNDTLVDDVTRLLASGDCAGAVRVLLADSGADLSFLLAELSPEERRDLLGSSSAAESAALIERIEPEQAAKALTEIEHEQAADILE